MVGLGNQLFQIFTTFAYCLRYGKQMILPYSKVLTVGITRNTYWDSLLKNLKMFTTINNEFCITNDELFEFKIYKEKQHHYNVIPEIIDDNVILFGFFQSPKYFQDQYDEILSLIKIEEIKTEIINEFSKYFLMGYTTISIHFRLGDYKFKQENHPIMSYEYYYNSLLHILCYIDTNKPVNVLYFCEKEDNHIIEEVIKNLEKTFLFFTFIKVDDSIEDWKQMIIMSNCNHNIIANSTFSWWGAFLNNNNGKIVCYPSQWFGFLKKHVNIDDMFPEDWDWINV